MTERTFVALVPVKPPARGKSRLVGVSDQARRELAEGFALDTVTACLAASRVAEVLVATDDAGFSTRLRGLGAHTIPDGVSMDLNETLRQSAAEARRRWPDLVPVALCADLPALDPRDLDEVLATASTVVDAGSAAFVADTEGVGTTLYTAPYDGFDPRFGLGSAAAHDAVGTVAVTPDPPRALGLRRDVDDLEDLREAVGIGVGVQTRRRAAPLLGDGPASAGSN